MRVFSVSCQLNQEWQASARKAAKVQWDKNRNKDEPIQKAVETKTLFTQLTREHIE
jgi:hypothetical protein